MDSAISEKLTTDHASISMTDNVDYLPVWKKNASPEERLLEVAAIARKHPERFSKMAIIYQEDTGDGTKTRYTCGVDITTTELVGLIELGKLEVMRETHNF